MVDDNKRERDRIEYQILFLFHNLVILRLIFAVIYHFPSSIYSNLQINNFIFSKIKKGFRKNDHCFSKTTQKQSLFPEYNPKPRLDQKKMEF